VIAVSGEDELASAVRLAISVSGRARIATRTCDGRLFAAAGVNLKSVSDRPLLANEAASLGSAPAGVKVDRGSKLMETAGAFFFVGVAANAGDSKRPTADTAASSFAPLERPRIGNYTTSCSDSI
jgi:hypothetical protein